MSNNWLIFKLHRSAIIVFIGIVIIVLFDHGNISITSGLPNYIPAFFAGIFATVVGVGLEYMKSHAEDRKIKLNIILVMKSQLAENSVVLDKNNQHLEQELLILSRGDLVVPPLDLLSDSFWDLFISNIPDELQDYDSLIKISNYKRKVNYYNLTIRSREIYRNNNEAMTSFQKRMEIYNQILQEQSHIIIYETQSLVQIIFAKTSLR